MNPWFIRWLILMLVLANLALFYWLRTETRQIVETVPVGVKRLVLVEELSPAVVVNDGEVAEISGPADVSDDDIATVRTAVESGTAALVQVAQEFVEQALEIAESVLATESCWLAGPLDQTAVREAVTGALATQGIQLKLVLQRVAAAPDYWVYLPVEGGGQQPLLLAAELREKGIDSYAITQGQLAGDLSLGLFRNEEHADSLMSRVRAQAYVPEIYQRPRSREQAWAALREVELAALGWEVEAGALTAYPSVRLVQRTCPDG